MAIAPSREMYSIADINQQTRGWTALVQVLESHRTRYTRGSPATQPKQYKRFVLIDDQGTKVSAVIYENDLRFFAMSLKPFKRYRITNANLTKAVAFFKVGTYEHTWVITHSVLVEPVNEPIPPPLPCSFDTANFNDFFRFADQDISLAIKGLVLHVFPRKQVTEETSHRELIIIDETNKPIVFTLWNAFGDDEAKEIGNDLHTNPLIIAYNVKVSTFHGISLSTRMYSYFLINPPLKEDEPLRTWFNSNKKEVDALMKNAAYKDMKMHLPPPAHEDVITVDTAVLHLPTNKTAWVVGQASFVPGRQRYWLASCSNCQKSYKAAAGLEITCPACERHTTLELRSRVPINLLGDNGTLNVTLSSPDMEELTGITPTQLKEAEEFGFPIEIDMKDAFAKLKLVCFLRQQDREYYSGPGLRYVAVKAYNAHDILPMTMALPPPHADSHELEEKNGNQIFTLATNKTMAEPGKAHTTSLSAIGNPKESSKTHHIVPAKRTLSFPENGDKTIGEYSNNDVARDDKAKDTGESPVKRSKEKLKMS